MAWAKVQEADSGDVNAIPAASVTATYGSTPVENNLLVAIVVALADNTGLTISSSGWTMAQESGTTATVGVDNPRLQLWYKVAGAGEATTVQASVTNTARIALQVAEFSGGATTSVLDVSYSQPSRDVNGEGTVWATAAPARAAGLWVMGIAAQQDDVGSTYDTPANVLAHSATAFSGTPTYRNGNDSTRCQLDSWWKASGDENAADMSATYGTAARTVGIAAVFKISGHSAVNTKASGAGGAAHVQNKTGTGTGVTEVSVTFTNTPTEGNLMVASILGVPASEAITLPSGWAETSDTANNVRVFWKKAGASEPTGHTFSWTTASNISHIKAEYSGVPLSSPVDVAAGAEHRHSSTNSTPSTAYYVCTNPLNTATEEEVLVIIFIGFKNASNTPGLATDDTDGYTQRVNIGVGISHSELIDGTFTTDKRHFYRTNLNIAGTSSPGTMGITMTIFKVAEDTDKWAWGDGSDAWAVA